jgi:hypothetical protein
MLLKEISIFREGSNSGDLTTFNITRMFNMQTHCMEDLYLRNLRPLRNNAITKLAVVLIDPSSAQVAASQGIKFQIFKEIESIGAVHLQFDFEMYFALNDYGKRLAVLERIQEGVEIFCQATGTDLLLFEEAYNKCIEARLENEYVLKANVNSKDKKFSATVVLRMDLNKLQAVAIVKNHDDGSLVEQPFFTTDPDILYGREVLGSIKWTDNHTLALFDKRDKNGHYKWELKF